MRLLHSHTVGVVVVVVVTAAFGTSSNLAHAYGMSVTATMLVTTLLTTVVASRW
jgi:K+ transporter